MGEVDFQNRIRHPCRHRRIISCNFPPGFLVVSLLCPRRGPMNSRVTAYFDFGKAVPALAVCLAVILTCFPLFSQGSAGRIDGTILDQTGGAIPAAKVTITDVQRGVARNLTTDSAGAYAAPNLTPGTYSVHVEFMGFRSVDRKDLVLEVGQDMRVDVTLQPGEQNQTVTVTGETPIVNTTSAELGGALQNQVINDLPLNGRNFENLLDLRTRRDQVSRQFRLGPEHQRPASARQLLHGG